MPSDLRDDLAPIFPETIGGRLVQTQEPLYHNTLGLGKAASSLRCLAHRTLPKNILACIILFVIKIYV